MQTSLELSVTFPREVYDYGNRASGEVHGVVLTKPHVVELILDLAGYTADRNLAALTLLEPSCGEGAFLVPVVERLIQSARSQGLDARALAQSIRAFDIDEKHVETTRRAVDSALRRCRVPAHVRSSLVHEWIQVGDFLLATFDRPIDICVGNPPYIRIEQLAPTLHAEYRRRYSSLFDRADLYVAFIERGLSLLSATGVLSFVCADRWVLNKYGAPLRKVVAQDYQVRCYVDLHNASPFESDVIAYPSIFVLARGESSAVPVVTLSTGSAEECGEVVRAISESAPSSNRTGASSPATSRPVPVSIAWYEHWFRGDEPWTMGSPEQRRTLRDLEARFEPIESTAHVGIGVATGLDRLFIVPSDIDIERDRLVPLVMRDDIEGGRVKASNRSVINAFQTAGGVVNLDEYPKLAAYLHQHASEIRGRHVAKKNPKSWFRTIDRVYPDLVGKPKLLIPDIAGANEVAFDPGHFHPHHNLYFVTSKAWDLEVLGGLLSSRVALFFVWSYALKMRGGYLRFQAQYLRRIRLPDPKRLPKLLVDRIRKAFRLRDFARLDELALEAYGLESLPAFDFVDTRK